MTGARNRMYTGGMPMTMRPIDFPARVAEALGPDGVDLATRIVHAGGYGVSRRGLAGAARKLAGRLVAAGHLERWTHDPAEGVVYTLSAPLAASLGLRLDGPRRRWLDVAGPGVGPTRVRPGKLATATDLQYDLNSIPSPPPQEPDRRTDDGGMRRPTVLVGSSMIWNGPGDLTGNPDGTCRACSGELRQPGHYCLTGDTAYGDPVVVTVRRKRTRAA